METHPMMTCPTINPFPPINLDPTSISSHLGH